MENNDKLIVYRAINERIAEAEHRQRQIEGQLLACERDLAALRSWLEEAKGESNAKV